MIFKTVKEMQNYITKNMDKLLQQVKSDKNFIKAAGETMVDDIQSNMKKGIQTQQNDTTGKKYDKLKESTIKYRASLKKKGELSSLTSPAKAQNIATGNLFDSLKYEESNGVISVKPKDSINTKKAEYLSDMGRDFLKISKKGVRALKDITSKFIMSILQKL